MQLPRHFCWTRFGTESGEVIGQILARKEDERRANGGIFLWGIGNALAPSMRELVYREPAPEVVFSPIRSKPRKEDVYPSRLVAWTEGRTSAGDVFKLPPGSMVTSRVSERCRRRKHYALVCASTESLCIKDSAENFSIRSLRNLLTGRQVGASQVTAIVQVAERQESSAGAMYAAAMRTRLIPPYFVELVNPVTLPIALTSDVAAGVAAWNDVLSSIRHYSDAGAHAGSPSSSYLMSQDCY